VPSTAEFASDWQEIRIAIGTILSSVAHADALIIDLRSNYGGDPNTIAFMLSYLLDDGPLHLLDFVTISGAVNKSFSTTQANDLPSDSERFGGTKPIYVLTTDTTIAGGEDMAYSLKAFKRASAIIGGGNEATAGVAGPITDLRPICEKEFGKGWWLVGVPNLKPIHAVTGTSWQGVGVKSDIVAGRGEWTGVGDAKEVARRLAMQDLQAKEEL
jgi:C-terminal processing protease CtpA/Prc